MYRIKELHRTPALLRMYNAKGSLALTIQGRFTNPIQIFTVPYSLLEIVLLDCAHSQQTHVKEIPNEKVALRS